MQPSAPGTSPAVLTLRFALCSAWAAHNATFRPLSSLRPRILAMIPTSSSFIMVAAILGLILVMAVAGEFGRRADREPTASVT